MCIHSTAPRMQVRKSWSVDPSSVGPGRWTQDVRLGGSTFIDWAISPTPKHFFLFVCFETEYHHVALLGVSLKCFSCVPSLESKDTRHHIWLPKHLDSCVYTFFFIKFNCKAIILCFKSKIKNLTLKSRKNEIIQFTKAKETSRITRGIGILQSHLPVAKRGIFFTKPWTHISSQSMHFFLVL